MYFVVDLAGSEKNISKLKEERLYLQNMASILPKTSRSKLADTSLPTHPSATPRGHKYRFAVVVDDKLQSYHIRFRQSFWWW